MTLAPMPCRHWCLAQRPKGRGLAAGDVTLSTGHIDPPKEGEVVVETTYLSLDPTIRLWLDAAPPVLRPIPLGAVVPSYGIGRITTSRAPSLPEGTLVHGRLGWRDRGVYPVHWLQSCVEYPGLPEEAQLALLGPTGATAWFGIEELAAPLANETVVVTAAAGAVGSLAVQLAQLRGARVLAIAGGSRKVAFLREELSVHSAVDYKAGPEVVATMLSAAGPVDVLFDNVGGRLRDTVMASMADGGRIVACGEIASGYADPRGTGLAESFAIISRALTLYGLRLDRFAHRKAEAESALASLAADGRLRWRTQVSEGLESAPEALNSVFRGENHGKALVRL